MQKKIISNIIQMIRVFYQLMYHRFNENKYPSTNIQMDIFKEQMKNN
jgi:hypothetical protein